MALKTITLNDGLLDLDQAAEYLGVPKRKLRDWALARYIDHSKLDYRTYRFKISDLDRFVAKRTRKAKTEVY